MSILDSNFLQKLDTLRLQIQGRFLGFRQALHRSKKVGMGVTFADHREYALGDDLRYVDWAMYARSEKLLLKRFEEEEDLPIYVMLDLSESMKWKLSSGSTSFVPLASQTKISETLSKYEYACQIALAFLYVALSELNTTFLYLHAESIVAEKGRTRGKEQIFSFAQFLEKPPTSNQVKTNLTRSLSDFLYQTKKPGLLLLLSDFYDESPYETSLQALGQQGFELMLVQLFDPQEAELPTAQEWMLEDIETKEHFSFTVSEQNKEAYRKQQLALAERLQFLSSSLGGSYLQANIHQPFEQFVLSQLFSA